MGAKLATTVYVQRPGTAETVRLDAGTEPAPELAALVTNPGAWEDGVLPDLKAKDTKATKADTPAADKSAEDNDGGDTAGTKPARKTTARKQAAD